MLAQQISGRNLWDAVMLSDPLRLGAFACARWPEEHNRSDVPQKLLRHRTGPNPLLIQSHCQAKQSAFFRTAFSSPVAAAANSPAARSKSIIVPHNKLRFDLVDRVHRDPDHDQQRCATKI